MNFNPHHTPNQRSDKGYRQLLAAIIIQAINDHENREALFKAGEIEYEDEPADFLRSEACAWCCKWLEVSHDRVLAGLGEVGLVKRGKAELRRRRLSEKMLDFPE